MSEFEITQRALDGGRPCGQLTLSGGIVSNDQLNPTNSDNNEQ